MFLVYEFVNAECMESPVNKCDMALFTAFNDAVHEAEKRKNSLISEGLIDFYEEFNGWSRQNMSYTLYYKSPVNIAGEPKEYVEIHIVELEPDVKLMPQIDLDCKEKYEEILGFPISKEEYSEIDGHIDVMILEYETADEFYEEYVWLYGYADWSEKLKDADEDKNLMKFLVSKQWLIDEIFSGDVMEYNSFLSEYTMEDTAQIYSKAVLHNQVVYEYLE